MKAFLFCRRVAGAIIFILAVLMLPTLLYGCDDECSHGRITARDVAADCDSVGGVLNVCLECGEEFITDVIAPVGHTLTRTDIAATCLDGGYSIYSCACGFEYVSDHTPPQGHVLTLCETPPTCEDAGYTRAACELCDYEYLCDTVPPLGHSFIEERKLPTALDGVGSTTYTCGCGFCYVGDYSFYSDVFRGAYAEHTEALARGVDVSYHNHNLSSDGSGREPLDWQAIRAAGYDFAILRAGYMGVKDVVFERNYEQAREAGLELGAYFYSYANNIKEAREEAYFCLSLLEGKQFEYPIFFDIEDERLERLGTRVLTDVCIEFISVLQENGYYGALYTNNRWLTTLLQTEKITTLFDVWYARYPSATEIVTDAEWNTEKYGAQTVMWQFSQTGVIEGLLRPDGAPIYFDLNYAYRDYPALIRELGYNGY